MPALIGLGWGRRESRELITEMLIFQQERVDFPITVLPQRIKFQQRATTSTDSMASRVGGKGDRNYLPPSSSHFPSHQPPSISHRELKTRWTAHHVLISSTEGVAIEQEHVAALSIDTPTIHQSAPVQPPSHVEHLVIHHCHPAPPTHSIRVVPPAFNFGLHPARHLPPETPRTPG